MPEAHPGAEHPDEYADAVVGFARMGWTKADWDDLWFQVRKPDAFTLDDPDRANENDWEAWGAMGGLEMRFWLTHPPQQFTTPVSPATVREAMFRHGKEAGQILNGYTAGASERFITALRSPPGDQSMLPAVGWERALAAGLDEPAATGWALTGYLGNQGQTANGWALSSKQVSNLIAGWMGLFGPCAYLWVLAGYSPEEACNIQDTAEAQGPEKMITNEQLRVQASLAGVVLPPGI